MARARLIAKRERSLACDLVIAQEHSQFRRVWAQFVGTLLGREDRRSARAREVNERAGPRGHRVAVWERRQEFLLQIDDDQKRTVGFEHGVLGCEGYGFDARMRRDEATS